MSPGIVRRAVLLTLVFSGLWLALASPASAALATLTGKVTDLSGAGIFNVTINFVDACTGVTSPATGNVTSSTGDFRATVNAGVYDLEFSPPAGSLYHAWRIRNFDLTVSRTLAPVRLGFGVLVSRRVNDSAGAGIPNVFVRFFPPGSSDRTFAVRDRADPLWRRSGCWATSRILDVFSAFTGRLGHHLAPMLWIRRQAQSSLPREAA